MNTWAFGIDEDERFASRRPIPSVPPGTGQVDLSDLFASTQPREGKWTQQESGWLLEKSDDSRSGLIHLPAELPDEFDLSLRVVRRFSRYENGLWIGCPWTTPNQRKTQVFVLGDLEGSGLNDFQRTSRYDHHGWRDRHRQFPIDRPVDVVIKVRAEAVSIEIDGRLVLTVEGPPSNQLSDWNQLGKFDDGIGLRAFGRFEIQHVRIQSP